MKKKTSTDFPIVLEIGVKVFIVNKNGHYLLLKRAKPYPGQKIKRWDIPGGRIQPGEPTLAALKREVKEETGLTLKPPTRILNVQDILRVAGKHTVRITYLAGCENEIRIKLDPNEHEKYKWATLKELKNSPHDIYLTPIIVLLTSSS